MEAVILEDSGCPGLMTGKRYQCEDVSWIGRSVRGGHKSRWTHGTLFVFQSMQQMENDGEALERSCRAEALLQGGCRQERKEGSVEVVCAK